MIFGCPNCDADCPIPDDKIANKILKVRCQQCKHVFYVKDPALDKQSVPNFNIPASPDDDEIWFYAVNQESMGPVSVSAMRHLIESSQVMSSTLVWCEGMAEWTPLANTPELTSILQEIASPKPGTNLPIAPGLEDVDDNADDKSDLELKLDFDDEEDEETDLAIDLNQDADEEIVRKLMAEEEALREEFRQEVAKKKELKQQQKIAAKADKKSEKTPTDKNNIEQQLAEQQIAKDLLEEEEHLQKERKESLAERKAKELELKEAEEAKRKAEAEKQKAAEEVKRKAEAEKQKTAKETKRKAEAEKQKAAKEAKRKAEAEKQKAAKEAKRKAETKKQKTAKKAKRKAEAEKQKAAKEAKRKAQAERQKKAAPIVDKGIAEDKQTSSRKVMIAILLLLVAASAGLALTISDKQETESLKSIVRHDSSTNLFIPEQKLPEQAIIEQETLGQEPPTEKLAVATIEPALELAPKPEAKQIPAENKKAIKGKSKKLKQKAVDDMRKALGQSSKKVAAKPVPNKKKAVQPSGSSIEMPPVPFAVETNNEPLLPDDLSQGQIKFVVNRHISRIRFCYDSQLRRNPNTSGKLKVSFTIENTGRVSYVGIKGRRFKGTFLETCVSDAIKKWRFPRFAGEPISVDYPFIFSSF